METYNVSIENAETAEKILAYLKAFPDVEVTKSKECCSGPTTAQIYKKQILEIIEQKSIPCKKAENCTKPLFVLKQEGEVVTALIITTDSAGYKITEWQQAGLDKQSYVDIKTMVEVPISALNFENQAARLTNFDANGLIEFLLKDTERL